MLAKGFWFHASWLLNSNIIRSQGMTPQITAHYCELTWFRPWFHLVPHVCTSTKFQLTIVNWFGSGFGSTWFRMLAEAPNLSSLLGIDLVPDLVPLGCEELLPTMYWGSVGLMGRLHKKCLSFSHQHREPNVNWIFIIPTTSRIKNLGSSWIA